MPKRTAFAAALVAVILVTSSAFAGATGMRVASAVAVQTTNPCRTIDGSWTAPVALVFSRFKADMLHAVVWLGGAWGASEHCLATWFAKGCRSSGLQTIAAKQ